MRTNFCLHRPERLDEVPGLPGSSALRSTTPWDGARRTTGCNVASLHLVDISPPLFSPGASATEASPVGIGQSVIVTNTYGYATFSNSPSTDTNVGGLQRVDVNGNDCDIVWTKPIQLTAMVKMSVADGNLYTVARTVTRASGTPPGATTGR